jgi:hypothetical protein
VLERLGEVYRHDAEARDSRLTPVERLHFHQERSRPVMEKLHGWLEAQFAERRTEPIKEFWLRSGSATSAKTWMVSRLACGISTATNRALNCLRRVSESVSAL